ncbi:MBL fold metallo-hydrolase [Blautia sp. RD014234]|nr:MBL fold metallo-hydrolase [Blautia parvula]
MKLTFIGATHEVTGSCYFLEAAGKKFLVDCGMEQGPDQYENQEIPVALSEVDFALLTHAHIDHSGNFPLAYAKGFRGPIYATNATCDLCDIMLRDSAHIQMFEAEWRNRKGQRNGQPDFVPAYTMEDALNAIKQFVGCEYSRKIQIADGIQVRFVDAGHLLGSSSIEIWITEEGVEKKIVFSGDIGNLDQPLIKDPEYLDSADYVVMESTYGDRSHGERPDYARELVKILKRTFDKNGNVVVPSFAVGRTQEMLYFLRRIKEENMLPEYPYFDVYVDSPLAVQATNIFKEHYTDCYDEEAMALIEKGINPIAFPGLKLSITSDESRAINMDDSHKVILSASGMCDAGRIKHHLKHNLWRRESTIVFVGYQAVGTLGRALLEGATDVRLFGEEIHVCADIVKLPGISGHADDAGLMRWASSFKEKPKRVFVTHGDDQVCDLFAERLKNELGYDAMAPFSGTEFDMLANEFEKETVGIVIKHAKEKAKARKASGVYARLLAAGQRLMTVIRHNEGGANKDLAKFADRINSMCDKWDR